jgi:hypothetical protein
MLLDAVEEVVDTALDSLVEVVAEVNINATHPSIVGLMADAVTPASNAPPNYKVIKMRLPSPTKGGATTVNAHPLDDGGPIIVKYIIT